jgi:hypothetical protein
LTSARLADCPTPTYVTAPSRFSIVLSFRAETLRVYPPYVSQVDRADLVSSRAAAVIYSEVVSNLLGAPSKRGCTCAVPTCSLDLSYASWTEFTMTVCLLVPTSCGLNSKRQPCTASLIFNSLSLGFQTSRAPPAAELRRFQEGIASIQTEHFVSDLRFVRRAFRSIVYRGRTYQQPLDLCYHRIFSERSCPFALFDRNLVYLYSRLVATHKGSASHKVGPPRRHIFFLVFIKAGDRIITCVASVQQGQGLRRRFGRRRFGRGRVMIGNIGGSYGFRDCVRDCGGGDM